METGTTQERLDQLTEQVSRAIARKMAEHGIVRHLSADAAISFVNDTARNILAGLVADLR